MSSTLARIAVVGAGMAGCTCARFLADAGFEVQLFDKSRGVGGRLSTRRAEWTADDGSRRLSRFDHGTPAFSARAPEFVRFVEQAARDGLVSRWLPRLATGSYAPLDESVLWLPTPDMPALCRALVADLPVHTGFMVDALQRGPAGWSLHAGPAMAEGFAAVIVAIPPAQAAPLLQPHRAEWARRAETLSMLPNWVLMGVTDDPDDPDQAPPWDLAWPMTGPLARVVRNDAKPGRTRMPGLAHWVAHATTHWSQTYLEAPADEVQAALQSALSHVLGRTLTWHHAAVHRWRYASVPRASHPDTPSAALTAGRCWWDAPSGLGVCGDALGGSGVEGAWCSARALADRITEHGPGWQARDRAEFPPLAHP